MSVALDLCPAVIFYEIIPCSKFYDDNGDDDDDVDTKERSVPDFCPVVYRFLRIAGNSRLAIVLSGTECIANDVRQ